MQDRSHVYLSMTTAMVHHLVHVVFYMTAAMQCYAQVIVFMTPCMYRRAHVILFMTPAMQRRAHVVLFITSATQRLAPDGSCSEVSPSGLGLGLRYSCGVSYNATPRFLGIDRLVICMGAMRIHMTPAVRHTSEVHVLKERSQPLQVRVGHVHLRGQRTWWRGSRS